MTIADDFLEEEEDESLIQKFSKMEIEEDQKAPQGACARKLT